VSETRDSRSWRLRGDPLDGRPRRPSRLPGSESKVFQLPLQLSDAKAVSQGGVDGPESRGRSCGAYLRERVERAHVVEAVGELDEDDPEVLRHGDHQLSDVLGLLLLVGTHSDPAQFRDPVNQPSDLGPNSLSTSSEVRAVSSTVVVQQGGRDRLGRQAPGRPGWRRPRGGDSRTPLRTGGVGPCGRSRRARTPF